jgi:hypothetical protein
MVVKSTLRFQPPQILPLLLVVLMLTMEVLLKETTPLHKRSFERREPSRRNQLMDLLLLQLVMLNQQLKTLVQRNQNKTVQNENLLPSLESLESLENLENLEHLRNLESLENIENLEHLENIENLKSHLNVHLELNNHERMLKLPLLLFMFPTSHLL